MRHIVIGIFLLFPLLSLGQASEDYLINNNDNWQEHWGKHQLNDTITLKEFKKLIHSNFYFSSTSPDGEKYKMAWQRLTIVGENQDFQMSIIKEKKPEQVFRFVKKYLKKNGVHVFFDEPKLLTEEEDVKKSAFKLYIVPS